MNRDKNKLKNWIGQFVTPSLLAKVGLGFLLLTSQILRASECYNYHTLKEYALIKTKSNIYCRFTEKDPNGFSYVRQINRILRGIDRATYKAIGEDERNFMFADKNGYYVLPKQEQYEEKTATFFKLLSPNESQKNINGRLFLINGKWTYLNAWGKNITKIVLSELPENLTDIKCYSYGMYVKSDKNVFAINIDEDLPKKYTLEVMPNLNPAKVVYYACNELNNEDYIADENHIFSIRNEGKFEDITPQFLALGIKINFNHLKLTDASIPLWWGAQMILKKRFGTSAEGKNPITGEDIDIDYSYSASTPLIPINGKISYILHQNKIYPIWDDNFSQTYHIKTAAEKLKAMEGKLFRGDDFYYIEADDDLKIISTNISADARFFPGVYSYAGYLPKALLDDDYIHFIGDRFNINLDNKKALTGKIVKQLGMFYLYNNALFDGEKSYPITADYKTLNYLGSFVEEINGCAGDIPNSEQVKIKYHHFFKDNDAVYYFDNNKHQLQIIQTANPEATQPDDYEFLQNLYKIKDVKGTVKKKTNEQPNYFVIAGLLVIILGVGVYLFRRRA